MLSRSNQKIFWGRKCDLCQYSQENKSNGKQSHLLLIMLCSLRSQCVAPGIPLFFLPPNSPLISVNIAYVTRYLLIQNTAVSKVIHIWLFLLVILKLVISWSGFELRLSEFTDKSGEDRTASYPKISSSAKKPSQKNYFQGIHRSHKQLSGLSHRR